MQDMKGFHNHQLGNVFLTFWCMPFNHKLYLYKIKHDQNTTLCVSINRFTLYSIMSWPPSWPSSGGNTFTYLKKAPISFTCLSLFIYELNSSWMDFHKILCYGLLWKSVKKPIFNYNMIKISGTLDEYLSKFYCCWQLKSP